jgi:hypothetical protein
MFRVQRAEDGRLTTEDEEMLTPGRRAVMVGELAENK